MSVSYNAHIRGSLSDLRQAAGEPLPFPPPGAARLVSDAIHMLKAEGAPADEIAETERLSVLLHRLEVASWANDPDEVHRIRDAAKPNPSTPRSRMRPSSAST